MYEHVAYNIVITNAVRERCLMAQAQAQEPVTISIRAKAGQRDLIDQAADIAGITALLVQAISEQARRFYLSRGFVESPIKPMTLCLMPATVRQALREP